MDDNAIKNVYLYGRNNGLGDAAAADFVDWYIQHEDDKLPLNVALQAWRDELDNFNLWQNELQDSEGGMTRWEGLLCMGLILIVFYFICQGIRAVVAL